MTLLQIKNLSASLGGREVLHGVSLSVTKGELVGLIGPNGAGKSTLLRAAAGLLPARGEIALDGQSIKAIPTRTRARQMAYLPQDRVIAWPVSTRLLVSLGRGPHQRTGQPLGPADHAAIARAMDWMDVAQFANRPATALSGGEQARVLIARALAQEAPLLLADEPVAGLDPAHQITLMERFRTLASDGDHAVLVSLHDLGLAARWCSRLVVLDKGRIVADGAPMAVLSDDLLARVYGIRAYRSGTTEHPIIVPTGKIDGA